VDTTGRLTPERIVALYERHAADLFRYCARRVGPDRADDIVASVFLTAYERRDSFDPAQPNALPWLYGIATNHLRRHRRDEIRGYRALARTGFDPLNTNVVDSHAARSDERADADAFTRRLAAMLAALPHRHRDVLLLYAVAEMEPTEIAAALGLPAGTVRSYLSRARARLRAALADTTSVTVTWRGET
jgi:RNA polymerase sigma factor (sigma-70 family)